MKALLDENLPRKLKYVFPDTLEVYTVPEMGWQGKKNGTLMRLLIEDEFRLFITIDKNLPYQQNLSQYPITLVVLNAPNNRFATLKEIVEQWTIDTPPPLHEVLWLEANQ